MSDLKVKLFNNPYGRVSYETFGSKRLAIADKSGFIKYLDDECLTAYPVLLRPRRFGKSTFVQMLKCFYDISYKSRYEEIFSGTDIYNENLESRNSYHVLTFNFSGVSGEDKDSLIDSFIVALKGGMGDFRKRYPDFVFEPTESEKKNPASFFKSFLYSYNEYSSSHSLYVMVDEYDNFANNVLSHDLGLFQAITGSGGFLKDFYAAMKEGAETCIAKIFITGVSSVSLDSLTSGFNIARNITSRPSFNSYAGFTETELAALIPKLVDTKKLGASVEEIIARMKPVYDGYCFSKNASHTMFNSSMCLYYLDEISVNESFLPPEDCMDPASDHDGYKLKQLFEIAEDGLADEIIETYLSGDSFFIKTIAENTNLNKAAKYKRDQFLSMLYYMGYLTIDRDASDSSSVALKIPNLFMSKLFAGCIAELRLNASPAFSDYELDITPLCDVQDDISAFAASCTEFMSGVCTNQVLSHMSEMALNLTLYTKIRSIRDVFVEMQKSLQVEGDGERFADLVITVNKGKSSECSYIIELKYMQKSQYSEQQLANLIEKASLQVLKYKSARDFAHSQVKAFVMVFAGPGCVYCKMQ